MEDKPEDKILLTERKFECEHLAAHTFAEKHPVRVENAESDKNRLICGICNCHMDYDKREAKQEEDS